MASRLYWSQTDDERDGLPPEAPLVIGLLALSSLAVTGGKLVAAVIRRIFRGVL